MTSKWRRCDVVTLHRRQYDVMCLMGICPPPPPPPPPPPTVLNLPTPMRGGRVVQCCRVNFQCRGILLILIIVGQGPLALVIGAGGDCLDIFLSSVIFTISLSLRDGPIWTAIPSQRAVKPKTTNQPTTPVMSIWHRAIYFIELLHR